MSDTTKGARNARIEALRLVAIAGIAVFHTFQPWFSYALAGDWDPAPLTLAALGVVSLLGSFGNHVFFLVSGLFLVPRAAAASTEPGYWAAQARATARRAAAILASVALYAAVALGVSAWVTPVAGVSLTETSWLVGGLEFIWVYLVVVALSPLVGWVWERLSQRRLALAAIVLAVLAVNAYIAFVSPGEGERSLLEWRKLMSAVSYLTSFLVGGALADAPLRRPGLALALVAALAVGTELVAALAGDAALLAALSYKSTSAIAFALAATSVALAAHPPAAPARDLPAASLVRRAARSILGFYIAQSVFSPLWRPAFDDLTLLAAQRGDAELLVVGTAASLAFVAVVLAVDGVVRVSLLKRLRLA